MSENVNICIVGLWNNTHGQFEGTLTNPPNIRGHTIIYLLIYSRPVTGHLFAMRSLVLRVRMMDIIETTGQAAV